MMNGEAYQVRDIAQFELFHDIRTMNLHRFDAQRQLVGNFLVRASFCYQPERLNFTRSQDAQSLSKA